jgi:isocitrate dehydrogenase
LAKELGDNEAKIVEELIAVQGKPQDIAGYYLPGPEETAKAMRPNETFNKALDSLG